MKEAGIGRDQALIADDKTPKVTQPGKRPLDVSTIMLSSRHWLLWSRRMTYLLSCD